MVLNQRASSCQYFLGTHLLNRERVRCWRFGAAARREEEEYPSWIFDRRASPKAFGPAAPKIRNRAAKRWQTAGCVAPQSQPRKLSGMLLRRALPAARQRLAHPFPI
jgi:hypothetical protein